MSQHDFNIDNQSAPAFRGDLNNALEALGTLSSGATAPATTYANMLWYDTATNILKMRSEADDAWIALGTLDQSANTFAPAGVAELTQVQVEDDTSTVFGQVSGERLAQAVAALAPTEIGAINTYAMLFESALSTTSMALGTTRAGSSLDYNGVYLLGYGGTPWRAYSAGASPDGTWRLMGLSTVTESVRRGGVWLRIS